MSLKVNVLHFCDIRGVVDFNHFKPLVFTSKRGVVMVAFNIVVTVGTMRCCHWYNFSKVGEVYSIFPLFASRDDGHKVVAPHELVGNVGGPDLTRRTRRLCRSVQEDHQLKVLVVDVVYCHLKERAALVDDVVQSERAHKEGVVIPSIHHEVDAHLIHYDCLPVRCCCGSQKFAIDLASNHQGLAEVGHSNRQAKGIISGANDGHFTKCNGLRPLFG